MTKAIKEDRLAGATPAELEKWIRDCAALESGGKVFSYVETIEACTLKHVPSLETWLLPASTLAGRVFGGGAEVRWQAEGDERFGAWSLEEVAPGTAGSRQVTADEKMTKYYLIGLGTKTPGVFEEARYPGVAFSYPIDEQFGNDHDKMRAYIEVQEYCSPEPSIDEIKAASVEDVTTMLNRPRLVAHRFVSVEADKGVK